MNVTLPEKLEAWIEAQVRAGHYRDVNEIVQIGLEKLIERNEKLEALKTQLQEGSDALEAGRFVNVESREHFHQLIEEKANANKPQ